MSKIDILHLSDIDIRIRSGDELVQQVGFPSTACVERFLSAWGKCLCSIPRERRPRGLVFFLAPPASDTSSEIRLDRLQDSLQNAIDSLASSQLNGELHTISLTGDTSESQVVSADIRRQTRGGSWTPDQTSQLSAGVNDRCVCWASGLSFKVFSKGVSAISYTDITNRSFESASETYQRQGWGDGELIEYFGSDRLNDRTRRGIWHIPAYHVLRNRPEELIEDMLMEYLQGNLLGFEQLTKEYNLESEGRVDVGVVLADGTNYIVEIKWIGRSIKTAHQNTSHEKLKTQLKKWACDCVTVLGEANARNGVSQLAHYLAKPRFHKGYLAIYDCRQPGSAKSCESAVGYPKPANLATYQYKICHVAIDPRSASKKSKDGQNVVW